MHVRIVEFIQLLHHLEIILSLYFVLPLGHFAPIEYAARDVIQGYVVITKYTK